MDDAGPQSLFVVVSYTYLAPYFSSIFLLEKKENNRERRPKLKRSSSLSSLPLVTPLNQNLTLKGLPKITTRSSLTYSLDPQKDFVAHLTRPQSYPPVFDWKFCTPAISADELCMVLDPGWRLDQLDVEFKGFILNLSTTNCRSIKPPLDWRFRFYKHVVALGGYIYFLTYSCSEMGSFFMRYSPLDKSWDNLEPFPDGFDDGHDINGKLLGTVVLDDTIVLNMVYVLWAYNVSTDKWYQVNVGDRRCYNMLGDAVVLGNTIYALTDTSRGIVLALSIKKKGTKVLKYDCSLLYEIEVPGMEEDYFKYKGPGWSTRQLVHLGEDNFCLVHCCNSDADHVDCQPIQVTYIKLEKGQHSMTVTDKCIYNVKILEDEQFRVDCCFSLPNHKTAALGKGSFFHINPFPVPEDEDDLSEEKDKNRKAEVPEVTPPPRNGDVVNNNDEGHLIFVRNLPKNADVTEVEKEVEKFGAIKRDGIKFLEIKKVKCAYVGFESAISKQRALEASFVIIRGCLAQISAWNTSPKKKKKRKKMKLAS